MTIIILRRISVYMYVCVTLRTYTCTCSRQTLLFATGTLRNEYGFGQALLFIVLLGHFEMIMGLDMNNVHVMDNNWVLFCIWRV